MVPTSALLTPTRAPRSGVSRSNARAILTADDSSNATASWRVRPRIVVDAAEKHAAFRVARAALAKSGTVTLELALAGVPMVTAYRVSAIEYPVGRLLIRGISTVILANLVLGEHVVPEFLQGACTADRIAEALIPLLEPSEQRQRQIEAFSRLDRIMEIGGPAPAARAADIVLGQLRQPAGPFAGMAPNRVGSPIP